MASKNTESKKIIGVIALKYLHGMFNTTTIHITPTISIALWKVAANQ
jgi:hypothetical protein